VASRAVEQPRLGSSGLSSVDNQQEMTPNEAAQILEALARGIDPETGEVFPEDSPLNNTHVVRALFMGAKALTDGSAASKPKREAVEGEEQAWKPWSKEEEERLLAGFDSGVTVQELAAVHKRKVGGITARLVKLGRLEPGT
jgi:hypothetical protein